MSTPAAPPVAPSALELARAESLLAGLDGSALPQAVVVLTEVHALLAEVLRGTGSE